MHELHPWAKFTNIVDDIECRIPTISATLEFYHVILPVKFETQ